MLHLADRDAGRLTYWKLADWDWLTYWKVGCEQAFQLWRAKRAAKLADILTTCWLGLTNTPKSWRLFRPNRITDCVIDCFPGLFNNLIPAWHRLNDQSWLTDLSDIMTSLTLWMFDRRCLICWEIRSNLQTHIAQISKWLTDCLTGSNSHLTS